MMSCAIIRVWVGYWEKLEARRRDCAALGGEVDAEPVIIRLLIGPMKTVIGSRSGYEGHERAVRSACSKSEPTPPSA